ncbi:hypothetical protein GCM10022280_08660 [Sphingomonas swuensis]|uniref:Uncharacterized protein n=1 Tax=Sphingomonas swuensis TaxID=977800 RepID=A0ABP7SKS0_9SPHN
MTGFVGDELEEYEAKLALPEHPPAAAARTTAAATLAIVAELELEPAAGSEAEASRAHGHERPPVAAAVPMHVESHG